MHKFGAFLFIIFYVLSANAHVKRPCYPPTKEYFIENILTKSDLVIYGKVIDQSQKLEGNPSVATWTKLQVLEVLHGMLTETEIIVADWQAFFAPLYVQRTGSYLVLWLKQNGSKYRITDIDANNCIPSIWDAAANKTTSDIVSGKVLKTAQLKKHIAEILQNLPKK